MFRPLTAIIRWIQINKHILLNCRCYMETLLPSSKYLSTYYHLDDVALPAPLLHALLRRMLPHFDKEKCVHLPHSEEKAFLMDALQCGRTFCVTVTSSFPMSGSNLLFQQSAVPTAPYKQHEPPCTPVRTASLNAPSFWNFPHLSVKWNCTDLTVQIYCSTGKLQTQVSLYRNHHIRNSGYCWTQDKGWQLPWLMFCGFPQTPHQTYARQG